VQCIRIYIYILCVVRDCQRVVSLFGEICPSLDGVTFINRRALILFTGD